MIKDLNVKSAELNSMYRNIINAQINVMNVQQMQKITKGQTNET